MAGAGRRAGPTYAISGSTCCLKIAALPIPRFARIAAFDRVLRSSQAPAQLRQPTPISSGGITQNRYNHGNSMQVHAQADEYILAGV